MAQVIARGRRLFVLFFTVFSLNPVNMVRAPVLAWAGHWWANRQSIILFAAVNTSITTLSEMVSRSVVPSLHDKVGEQGFFVTTPSGSTRIHHQSMISIFMTLIASLAGGPVYFITRRRNRFLFFFAFGTCNSIFAQQLSGVLLPGISVFHWNRWFFDIVYNFSVKYQMFEFVRPYLLRVRSSVAKVWGVRVVQDLLTTIFRVAILNFLGFRG